MSGELEVVTGDGVREVVMVAHSPHLIEALAIQVVALDDSARIEPLRSGDSIEIDGEDYVSKELSTGEFVVIGGWRLRWLGGGNALGDAAASGAGRSAERGQPASVVPSVDVSATGRRSEQLRRKGGVPASAVTAGILVVVIFLVIEFNDSTLPDSPAYYLELAQAQYKNGDSDRALELLTQALEGATGEVRDQALSLQVLIERVAREQAVVMQLSEARYEMGLIKSFEKRYLGGSARPVAREGVRLCDDWLRRHREMCLGHSDGKTLLDEVVGIRSRYEADAELESSDTAADVIFAARSRLRFQWRDYKGAFGLLDAFLAANADDQEVEAERGRMLAEGEEWLQEQLRRLDLLMAGGNRSNAERDLRQIDRWVLIPEWEALIEERRRKVTPAEKQ